MKLDVWSFFLLFILAGASVAIAVIVLRVVVKGMSPFRFISKIRVIVPKGYMYHNEAQKFFGTVCAHCCGIGSMCNCYQSMGDQNEKSAIIPGKKYIVQLYGVKKRFCISCADIRKFTLKMGGVLTGLSGLLLVNLLQNKEIIPPNGTIVAISDYNSYITNDYGLREIPVLGNCFESLEFNHYLGGHKFGEEDYFLVFIPLN